MSVGIVLLDKNGIEPLIRWAAHFARARHDGLVILQVEYRIGDENRQDFTSDKNLPPAMTAITAELMTSGFRWAHVADSEDAEVDRTGDEQNREGGIEQDVAEVVRDETDLKLAFEWVSLQGKEIAELVFRETEALKIKMLIVPRKPTVKISSSEFAVERRLLSELSCQVVELSIGQTDGRCCTGILAPVSEQAHSQLAFSQANDLAIVTGAKVTALFVEPALDEVAKQVGQRMLARNVSKVSSKLQDDIIEKVVLSNDVDSGILNAIEPEHDIVVLGRLHHGVVHRFLFRSVSEALIQANPRPAIAVIQTELPLASRLLRSIDRNVKAVIPQLDRDQRVRLVERIQSSSSWNFDFVALISLSTLIAAGGLIQNSPAVVIGAMLVAPLMTPLLGTGLSLVQGNSIMFRNTIATVLRGFILAYVIGCVLGGLFHTMNPTSEMIARGSPGILDLLVAFVSGVAAAYANGRPNLLSALPGVAIAASLVPPIATAGIATVLGEPQLALGAALLFLTNIVAIVLGTACSFWGVGIRGSHDHGKFSKWAITAGLALVLLTVSLAIYESMPANRISPELHSDLNGLLKDQDAACDEISWRKIDGIPGVNVDVASARPLSNRAEAAIVQMVRNSFDKKTRVRIRTRLTATFD